MNKEFIKYDLEIRSLLSGIYSHKGYSVQKDYTGFFIQSNENEQKIILGPTSEYSSSIVYRPSFNSLNKEVHQVKSRVFGKDSDYLGYTILTSQGSQLAEHYGVSGYEDWTMYDIKEESDIQPMVDHHKEFMNKVGWQFLEQIQSIEGIHNYLNTSFINIVADSLSQEEKTRLVRHNGVDWMVNGLVAAWLLKDINFNQLVEKYRDIYFPEHIQQTMDILLKSLI